MFSRWHPPLCLHCNYPLVKTQGQERCPNCFEIIDWIKIEKMLDKKKTMGRRQYQINKKEEQ